MATTLAQKAALAIDTTFIAQIKMQIIYEANYQLTAPKPASSQIKYDKLMSLSKSIIQSPDSNAIVFANKGGTAFPIILYCSQVLPQNSKSSGNDCNLAASLTVTLLACFGSG